MVVKRGLRQAVFFLANASWHRFTKRCVGRITTPRSFSSSGLETISAASQEGRSEGMRCTYKRYHLLHRKQQKNGTYQQCRDQCSEQQILG